MAELSRERCQQEFNVFFNSSNNSKNSKNSKDSKEIDSKEDQEWNAAYSKYRQHIRRMEHKLRLDNDSKKDLILDEMLKEPKTMIHSEMFTDRIQRS